jgi:hypothetical protein
MQSSVSTAQIERRIRRHCSPSQRIDAVERRQAIIEWLRAAHPTSTSIQCYHYYGVFKGDGQEEVIPSAFVEDTESLVAPAQLAPGVELTIIDSCARSSESLIFGSQGQGKTAIVIGRSLCQKYLR